MWFFVSFSTIRPSAGSTVTDILGNKFRVSYFRAPLSTPLLWLCTSYFVVPWAAQAVVLPRPLSRICGVFPEQADEAAAEAAQQRGEAAAPRALQEGDLVNSCPWEPQTHRPGCDRLRAVHHPARPPGHVQQNREPGGCPSPAEPGTDASRISNSTRAWEVSFAGALQHQSY